MSILSKVKKNISRGAKDLVSRAKKVAGSITKAVGLAASKSVASSVSAGKKQIQSNTASASKYIGTSGSAPRTISPAQEARNVQKGIAGLKAASAGKPTSTIGSRGGSSGGSTASPIYSAPVTIGGGTNRQGDLSRMVQTLSQPGLQSSFGSITTQSSAPQNSITMPSTPSVANPGVVNNGGLIGALAETSQYDPETNMFLPQQTDVQTPEGRLGLEQMLQEMIPQKESVLEDREVQKQQKEVNARKQEVANYTAQLNSVVAQQNADLLRLREIGSQEGVTETVYGGQQATINREAAIKALPIQAQIAAAQGALELAQDYLTQLTTWKQEQLDNDYAYRKEVYNSIRGFVDKEEEIQLKKMEKEDDRAYQESRDNIAEQDYWIREAVSNGQASLVSRINAINPSSPTFRQELANVVSAVTPKSSGSSVELSADKQRILLGGGFTAAEINQIESDVNKYGINSVLEGLDDPKQKKAVQAAYGTTDSSSNLTRENVASLFGMEDDNEVSGFFNGLPWIGKNQTNSQKLDEVMSAIEKYQAVGYSDEEILKMMK